MEEIIIYYLYFPIGGLGWLWVEEIIIFDIFLWVAWGGRNYYYLYFPMGGFGWKKLLKVSS